MSHIETGIALYSAFVETLGFCLDLIRRSKRVPPSEAAPIGGRHNQPDWGASYPRSEAEPRILWTGYATLLM